MSVLFSCFPLFFYTQITIDASHMPAAGDIFPFATAIDIGTADPTLTGEGVVWDYSFLQALAYDADTFITVEETPLAFQFFFNNGLLYPEHNADHARKEIVGDFGVVAVEDSYSYYKVDDDAYSLVGVGGNLNDVPISVRNEPVDVIYELPLTYADAYSGISTREVDLPSLGYYYGEQSRSTEVEGFGTLILPGGEEFEVLKLKVDIVSMDSVYTPQLGGFDLPIQEVTLYQWVAQEHGRPVLEIAEVVGQGLRAQYHAFDPALAVRGIEIPSANVFPNPAVEEVRISGEDLNGYTVRLLDALGRPCHVDVASRSSLIVIGLDGLADGYYTIELSDGMGRWTRGLIKE